MRPERPLAFASIACAAVAIAAVFLPWFESSMTSTEPTIPNAGEAVAFFEQEGRANGTEGPFLGTTILILAAVGIFGSALVAAGRDDLIGMRRPQTAVLAALLYGIATILAVVDVTRDVGGGSIEMGRVKVEAGKAIGVYLTTATAILATLAAAAAARIAARRPFQD